ncbi:MULTISPECIES: M48 family metallopeptidase [Sphingobium]|uniref:M48 family metallopeptidase n=1 Tax=Sphingobium TaxID=165695 RepID=UPI0015EB404A|nr:MULTISPECIES: SprT family zinc-dependent metalloprotease [Sphingobium]MCW2363860.1 putative metal-dependent hydrolase [Sphingobium sp. B10D3B]MCW2402743.1 putative metal-dependent hydrolase [Sphingobium sp. B10D7B]MCW2409722.1 putative metal-dependent hydrolase [Sphingobium xanthum]
MPTLQIGRAEIAYELRRSATASERRITITPGHVEVMALSRDNDADIAGFLERKRRWVFNTVREMERITSTRHSVPRFVTGSKIPYRGRKMPLTVRRTDAERIAIAYRNGFIVDLPDWAGQDADHLIASELQHWLKQRARRDVKEVAAEYGKRFGLIPRSIRVVDLANGWGSCGPEGNVLINWNLIFAPRKVLEYVVAHELAHLGHRSHGPEFWRYLAVLYPAFETPQAWLDHQYAQLSAAFLRTS